MDDRYQRFRSLAYILEIIVFFIVGQTPSLVPSIVGGLPNLLIPILTSIALFENEWVGLCAGFVCGLLLDTSFWDVTGFYVILMCTIGYFLGYMAVRLIKTNIWTCLLSTLACALLISSFEFLFIYTLRGYGAPQYMVLHHIFPKILYTLAVTPVIYLFNKGIAIQICEKE